MNLRADRQLTPLLFALGVFGLTLWAPQVFNDGDTWWHVAAGRLMIARHAVIATDPFSFSMQGRPWFAHEWLAEVLLGGAFNLAGWAGVALLAALAAGASVGMLARHVGRWLSGLPQVCVTLGGASLLAPHLLARPHVLAWPLLEAWAAELVFARVDGRAPRWRMLAVMSLWANLHASYLFGLALVAPFALEAVLVAPAAERMRTAMRWGSFGMGALAAALVTPHGTEGILYPLRMMNMPVLGTLSEWAPADFHTVTPLALCLAGAMAFLALRPVKVAPLRAVLLVALVVLALQHVRHEQLLAFVGTLVLAEPLAAALGGEKPAPVSRIAGPVLTVGALALGLALASARIAVAVPLADGPTRPVRALASVSSSVRATPVLNDFQYGGYLIGQGVRPYVDSRSDMYGEAFLRRYQRLASGDRAALATMIAQQHVRWALLVSGSPMDRTLAVLPGWRRTYADARAVVYMRAPT